MTGYASWTLALRLLAVALLSLLAGSAVGKEKPTDSNICAAAVAAAERLKAIPLRLMHAVALVESGRWDERAQAKSAWPWTIHAEGSGQFFATKRDAVDAVAGLRSRGVRNIDIGCMQVNLMYHPDAFATLDEAFDPVTNVAYAATFLAVLHEAKRSWGQAVRHYHSATPERQSPTGARSPSGGLPRRPRSPPTSWSPSPQPPTRRIRRTRSPR